ncbi:hypothetical protein EV2_039271 [Malus domestica]
MAFAAILDFYLSPLWQRLPASEVVASFSGRSNRDLADHFRCLRSEKALEEAFCFGDFSGGNVKRPCYSFCKLMKF